MEGSTFASNAAKREHISRVHKQQESQTVKEQVSVNRWMHELN